MKRLLMIALMAGMVFASQAQGGQRGKRAGGDQDERIEKAKENLGLSDEQFEQWKEVHEKYEADLKEARENRDREAGKALHEKMESELEAILTDEQKEKFAQRKKRGSKPRGSGNND